MLVTPKLLDASQEADLFARMAVSKMCETRTKGSGLPARPQQHCQHSATHCHVEQ